MESELPSFGVGWPELLVIALVLGAVAVGASLSSGGDAREPGAGHEGWALLWLTVGLALAPFGALVGVFMALRSTRWTARWKVAAISLSAATVFLARLIPTDQSSVYWSLALLVAVVLGAWLIRRRAPRAPGASRRVSWLGAALATIVLVSGGTGLARTIDPVGSYDLVPDVVAAAAAADAHQERWGSISSESSWIDGDGPTQREIDEVAGAGNKRFDPVWADLVTRDPGGDLGERRDDGECVVLPVVSPGASIRDATALARFCSGPSARGSYRVLSDR